MSASKQLPAPHDAVCVTVTWGPLDHLRVYYEAPSVEALHAAGCVDDAMLAFYLANPRKRMLTYRADGEFGCELFRNNGRLHSARLERRFYSTSEFHFWKTLPGVFEEDARNFLKNRTVAVAEWVDKVTTNRAVGRFQRMVNWASVDGFLIVPNWPMIRAQVTIAREAS